MSTLARSKVALALTYLALLVLGLATAGRPASAQDDAVYLSVGGKQTLELPDLAQTVKISRSGVIEVKRGNSKRSLVVIGKGGGSTNLAVDLVNGKTVSYMISVSDKTMLMSALSQAEAIPGVRAEIRGDKVVIGGTVRTQAAAERLAALKRTYGGLLVDGSQKDLPSNSTIVNAINNVLADNDIANLQAVAYGRIIALAGSAKDEQQQALALRIAKMIHPEIEDQTSKDSNGAPAISIEVMFIEVQRKNDKTVGAIGSIGDDLSNAKGVGGDAEATKTPAQPGFSVGVPGGGGQFGKFQWQVGSLTSFLKLIQTRAVSRVLSNPKLVSRSGQEAKFHSGGTFYLETKNTAPNGSVETELLPVDFGIKLGILPKIDTLGQIDTKLSTSIVDLGAKIAGRESITQSTVDTTVTIKDGQSILLSGLVRKTEKKKVDRVPLLADIPVVGELFKSRQSTSEESELLVLVTMSRIQPSDHKIDAADKLWQRGGDEVKFSAFD